MERVITCPVCFDTDHCFEEIQENYSSYLCFRCGFMSDSRYVIDSLQLTENLKKSPKLVQESKFEDRDRNIVWFPSVINMGKLGMIFQRELLKNTFGNMLESLIFLKVNKLFMTIILKDSTLKMHKRLVSTNL